MWLTIVLVLLVLALLFVSSIVLTFPTPRMYHYISKIPGPKGYFLLGNTLEMAFIKIEDILDFFMSKSFEYGRAVRLWVGGAALVILSEPEDCQVLLSSYTHISKGFEYLCMLPWLQEGLLTSTGRKWQTRRKMLTPSFHFKILEGSMSSFNKHGRLLCMSLRRSGEKSIPVHDYTTRVALDIIADSAMGIDLGTQCEASQDYLAKVMKITELAVLRMLNPLLYRDIYFGISSVGKEYFKLMYFIQNFTTKVIHERQDKYFSTKAYDMDANENKSKMRLAFLDTLLDIEARNPGSLKHEDIREEVDTFMFEGFDTTSQALTFFFYNMGTYQDIQEKVYRELEDIFENDWGREITTKDLQRMVYLEQTIKESLRLFPSVPYISRHLEKDLKLDGMLVPGGVNVSVMPYRIHRNEKHWPDPEKFDPERFNEENSAGRHAYAYIPFSAGARNCIGQKFAMMELKSMASMVLRDFRVSTDTKREDFKLTIHLILRPTVPIMCRFHPRRS